MFGWIRRWRRRKLRRRPLPEDWLGYLADRVPFFASFEGETRERFLEYLKFFVWEKYWIGAGGFEITEESKVVVSAAAVRLALHLDISVYDRLTEIVIYPSHYRHPDDDESVIFGEAHAWGIVVLSWDAVVQGLANPRDGHDTATHEFAHVLDRNDGAFDGTPELRARDQYRPWATVMSEHFLALRERGSKENRVLRGFLRDYGATNEAEFFAVATESFFEKPDQMKEHTPDLYEELKEYYGFDPAAGEVAPAERASAEKRRPVAGSRRRPKRRRRRKERRS